MQIPAAEFKTNCLKIMDEVEKSHDPVIITKRGSRSPSWFRWSLPEQNANRYSATWQARQPCSATW